MAAADEGILEALRSDRLEASEDLGRRLLAEVPAAELEAVLVGDLRMVPTILHSLGLALTAADRSLADAAGAYLPDLARLHGRRLAQRGGPWTSDDIDLLLTLRLIDPLRFVEEPAFREAVVPLLAESLEPSLPADLRDDLLVEFNRVRGVDFAVSDRIEAAWRVAPRSAIERQIPFSSEEFSFSDPLRDPIAASVFSLSSAYFTPDEAAALLTELRGLAPRRRLIVLADLPLHRQLEPRLAALDIDWLETYGRPYSPWPRDPFSFARQGDGAVRLVLRPNLQPGREEDAFLGAELVQNLPNALDAEWGTVRWATAPTPFHNGQILSTGETIYISVHSVEDRIMEMLGIDRVPVESFAEPSGIRTYFAAARRAADELAALYRRPVRFVHPLPAATQTVTQLAGGAGFDLDSLVALLPGAPGRPAHAVVADADRGRDLLGALTPDEWRALGASYRLAPPPAALADAVLAHHGSPRVRRLETFLDLVAEHLGDLGLTVDRLPLLAIPTALMADRDDIRHADFLVTWTNVVIDTTADGPRAEGFSGLLPAADRKAEEIFRRAGCPLRLLPPLIRSVQLLGGYRCASNHLRSKTGIIAPRNR